MKQKKIPLWRLAFLIFLGALSLLPFAYTLLNSFSDGTSYGLFPSAFSLQGYWEVFLRRPHYLVKFWNSLALCTAIVAGQTLISCLAGFGFSRFRFPGKEVLFFIVIIVMMMPYQVTLVSNYMILDKMGLLGNWLALILPGIFSPFGVFLMRQVFDACPSEYLEAAKLDGAGNLRILFRILIPRSRSGLASLVLLTFIDAWNMVEQPLVYLNDPYDYPLSVFLAQMSQGNVGVLCTCGVLAAIPVLLLFFYFVYDLAGGVAITQIH